jgi:hypothetical protein
MIALELLADLKSNPNSSYRYIILYGADLLIFSFKEKFLTSILSKYQNYQILFAEEDSLDVANTGMIIMNVTTVENIHYNYHFFQQWWQMKNIQNTYCDQHVLNLLSLQLQ